ncbi:metalloproteinase inhibitor 2-like [Syngnathus scovelli]|uniref:metalloproteinase inhibitor 2-like n=1 Tax=Syngnathus scovelli TaxID=161590 RepID=UPI002110C6D4|nr:metalloproteinase inhibitor 2-like [Syngnathus scovelli]
MSWKNFVLPLVLLALWGLQEEGAQACTCLPKHPQQTFCENNVVVIQAKVVGVEPGNSTLGGLTKYSIKHMRTFKGAEKHYHTIYTAPDIAACGVVLTKDTKYLLMGRLQPDGSLRVSSCDYIRPWESMSSSQRFLMYRYGYGCDCTIKSCFSYPCCMAGPKECVWTDLLPGKLNKLDQARNYACVKTSDDSCDWNMPIVLDNE